MKAHMKPSAAAGAAQCRGIPAGATTCYPHTPAPRHPPAWAGGDPSIYMSSPAPQTSHHHHHTVIIAGSLCVCKWHNIGGMACGGRIVSPGLWWQYLRMLWQLRVPSSSVGAEPCTNTHTQHIVYST
jgi:hypothetical protein